MATPQRLGLWMQLVAMRAKAMERAPGVDIDQDQ
jgi:hypothetical protein